MDATLSATTLVAKEEEARNNFNKRVRNWLRRDFLLAVVNSRRIHVDSYYWIFSSTRPNWLFPSVSFTLSTIVSVSLLQEVRFRQSGKSCHKVRIK